MISNRVTVKQLNELHAQIAAGLVTRENFQEFLITLRALATELTLGGRTYDIPALLREGETSVKGDIMVARAEEMGANSGQEDGEHFLRYQNEIPVALRDKLFVFTDGRDSVYVYYVYWGEAAGRWVRSWSSLAYDWPGSVRLPAAISRHSDPGSLGSCSGSLGPLRDPSVHWTEGSSCFY